MNEQKTDIASPGEQAFSFILMGLRRLLGDQKARRKGCKWSRGGIFKQDNMSRHHRGQTSRKCGALGYRYPLDLLFLLGKKLGGGAQEVVEPTASGLEPSSAICCVAPCRDLTFLGSASSVRTGIVPPHPLLLPFPPECAVQGLALLTLTSRKVRSLTYTSGHRQRGLFCLHCHEVLQPDTFSLMI